MRARRAALVVLSAAAAAIGVVVWHARDLVRPNRVEGGILIGDTGAYDSVTARLLGGMFDAIAVDVAQATYPGGRVLDVGCGPGHLALRMARYHGLAVTGVDLDPAMVERARANAGLAGGAGDTAIEFLVEDVVALPFPDGSFDTVVSTFSVHHWGDPDRGLAEVRRVLRPGGRVLIWDNRPGLAHAAHAPNPVDHVAGSGLELVSAAPWRYPRRLALVQRVELARPEA